MNNYSSLYQQAKKTQPISDNLPTKAVLTDNPESLSHKESMFKSNFPLQMRSTPNFLSFNSNTFEKKIPTDIGTIATAVTHCLKTQCQIASAVSDIGQYLKQFNEDANNLLYFQRKQATATAPFLSNRNSLSNQKYKPSPESMLQSILTKLDLIQSEIQLKLKEFEGLSQSSEFLNSTNLPGSTVEDKVRESHNIIFSPPTQQSLTHSKQSVENLLIRNSIGQMISNPVSVKTRTPISKGNVCDATSEVLDETPNMSKYYEISSTENSRMAQHEIPGSIGETHRLSNNVGKQSSLRKNKVTLTGNSQVKLLPKDNATTTHAKASANNTKDGAAKSNRKETVPAIKLDMLRDAMSHSKNDQTAPSKKGPQLNIELLRKNLQNYGQSTTIIARRDANAHKNTTQTSRPMLPEEHSEASEVGFMSAKNSPRDVLLDSGRLMLTILPKKEIDDDSIENGGDQTAQLDKSMLSIDEKMPSRETGQLLQIEINPFESNSQNGFQNFEAFLAKKEKVIIKTLMKDQYGEELISYHKADHGKIHQKKYLINARWWREWKEYVNFDAENEGGSEKTTSIFQLRHYPRPGAINNRELLRQDVVTDLANLTPELELKDNLLEHHDYEAVNKKVYDVLVKWYSSDFEICRVLRQDPFHEDRPYLELYPKKKPAKKSDPKSVDSNNELYASVISNIISSNLKHNAIS